VQFNKAKAIKPLRVISSCIIPFFNGAESYGRTKLPLSEFKFALVMMKSCLKPLLIYLIGRQ
jgi:hypothetical protein